MSVAIQTEEPRAEANGTQATPATQQPTIAFFGVFGIQNLGNECTLQSILVNARERLPYSRLYSICYEPVDTAQRHNLEAVPASARYFQSRASGEVVHRRGGVSRLFRILFQRIPGELLDWARAIKVLRGTDLVFMTGTGMVTDYATAAFGFPYDLFKWSVAARLAGAKVRFVGVGVGPLYSKVSRFLLRRALSLADYRSYRDEFSRQRIARAGFDSSKDFVFPDLVFSLPPAALPKKRNRNGQKPIVGLGVMDHRDIHLSSEEQDASYAAYLDKMCDFICWLLSKGYAIRILQGDVKYDAITRAELKAKLEARGIDYAQAGIADEGAATVDELMQQIAEADFIVSPRFHNLLIGLMLDIPGVSISYDPKNDALLDGFGMNRYHQALSEVDLQKLKDQFSGLESHANELKPIIRKRVNEYREKLEQQYELIFAKAK